MSKIFTYSMLAGLAGVTTVQAMDTEKVVYRAAPGINIVTIQDKLVSPFGNQETLHYSMGIDSDGSRRVVYEMQGEEIDYKAADGPHKVTLQHQLDRVLSSGAYTYITTLDGEDYYMPNNDQGIAESDPIFKEIASSGDVKNDERPIIDHGGLPAEHSPPRIDENAIGLDSIEPGVAPVIPPTRGRSMQIDTELPPVSEIDAIRDKIAQLEASRDYAKQIKIEINDLKSHKAHHEPGEYKESMRNLQQEHRAALNKHEELINRLGGQLPELRAALAQKQAQDAGKQSRQGEFPSGSEGDLLTVFNNYKHKYELAEHERNRLIKIKQTYNKNMTEDVKAAVDQIHETYTKLNQESLKYKAILMSEFNKSDIEIEQMLKGESGFAKARNVIFGAGQDINNELIEYRQQLNQKHALAKAAHNELKIARQAYKANPTQETRGARNQAYNQWRSLRDSLLETRGDLQAKYGLTAKELRIKLNGAAPVEPDNNIYTAHDSYFKKHLCIDK